jgi:hypothetical protein
MWVLFSDPSRPTLWWKRADAHYFHYVGHGLGIALCVFVYMFLSWSRGRAVTSLPDKMGMFFYALVLDAAIEALDWIHRCLGGRGIPDHAIWLTKLFYSLNLGQALLGTFVPLVCWGFCN